ncbi:2857_t:CDS:2 [Dentiscutata erythropus]|uniref:Ornithine decarboxylase antizyme n=1 Tax=Dentiscutata erythropus TaxID=1348616 RepID=A0A9N9JJ17_9GLOM|nr:2857_t:CDS:2 [Dentiscutata erythropus]
MAGNMNMIQMKDMSSSSSFTTAAVSPREQPLIAYLSKKTSATASKREPGGVPDMTPEFFLNLEEQGFLTRDSGKQVFRGGAPHIDYFLTIVSVQQHDCKWEGFVMNRVLFLKGHGLNVVELKESIVAILELAEECLKCNSLVVCLDKKCTHLSTLIRSFLYVGFELVLPGTFNHNSSDFLLVGMEL